MAHSPSKDTSHLVQALESLCSQIAELQRPAETSNGTKEKPLPSSSLGSKKPSERKFTTKVSLSKLEGSDSNNDVGLKRVESTVSKVVSSVAPTPPQRPLDFDINKVPSGRRAVHQQPQRGEQLDEILVKAKEVLNSLQSEHADNPSGMEEQRSKTATSIDTGGRIGGNTTKVPSSRLGAASGTASSSPQQQQKQSPSIVIQNALVTTHVASTLFIMLDTLASSVRASWGMLYLYNDTLCKLVLAASCGQRYARPGSVSIAVATHHFQPSLAGAASAAAATAPVGGGVIGLNTPQHSPQSPNAAFNNNAAASIESRVLETGIGVNITITGATDAKATTTIEEVDRMFHAREMAQLLAGGGLTGAEGTTSSDSSPFGIAAAAHEAKGRLSSEVARAHRTRTLLVLPVFKPGSHNSEVIGLLQLGNKMSESAFIETESGSTDGATAGFSLLEAPVFSEDDECRATEAAAFFANILAKFPYDLTHKNSHNHGINEKLATLIAGLPSLHKGMAPVNGGTSQNASHASTGNKGGTSQYNYFGAAVLRTSSLRAPQLVHRTEQTRLANIKRTDMKAGASLISFKGPIDEWREVVQSSQDTPHSTTNSPPKGGTSRDSTSGPIGYPGGGFSSAQQPQPLLTSPAVPRQVQPPAFLPQLPSGATVADALEHTIQVGESWKNAVLLNIELETETRRLHEALRICRREIARLQDMLLNMRQAGQQPQIM